MSDDLENIFRRWEAAVFVCERDGDDSDAAVEELDDSRAALLVLLRKALAVTQIYKPRQECDCSDCMEPGLR